jgi:hypothetical protein
MSVFIVQNKLGILFHDKEVMGGPWVPICRGPAVGHCELGVIL